jgi:hypothetical protein
MSGSRMKWTIYLGSRSYFVSLSLMLFLFTAPAWADIGNKTLTDAPASKVGQVKKEDKSLPDRDESKSDKKKDSSIKKSAA